MALLTRKGGGLPPNYEENYFWLNQPMVHVPTVEETEAEPAGEAGDAMSAAASAAVAVKPAETLASEIATPEPAIAAPETEAAQPEIACAEVAGETVVQAAELEVAAGVENAEATLEPEMKAEPELAPESHPEMQSDPRASESLAPESGAEVKTEEAAAVATSPAEVKELPKRGGTMLGLDADGEMPKVISEEDAKALAEKAAEEVTEAPKAKKRGFLGFGRRR